MIVAPLIELVSIRLERKPIQVKNNFVAEKIKKNASEPERIVDLLEELFKISSLAQEHFIMLTLDTKHKITGISTIGIGTSNATFASPKDIFTTALLNRAEFIIIAHNHPSGDPTPSQADINLTRRVRECGKILDIHLLDHIVIGDNQFVSITED